MSAFLILAFLVHLSSSVQESFWLQNKSDASHEQSIAVFDPLSQLTRH